MSTQTATRIYLGRDTEGARHWVDVTLRHLDVANARETIYHEHVTTYTELSIVGDTISKYCRTVHRCGQIDDTLRVSRFTEDGDISPEDRRILLGYWKRWHLNGMKTGCYHQSPCGSYDENKHDHCPKGYRYGSSWLIEPLPDDVIADIRRIIGQVA